MSRLLSPNTINRASSVYEAVCRHWKDFGYAPGYSRLMDATKLSRSTLYRYLHWLKRAGYITFEEGKRGTIRPAMPVKYDVTRR